MIEVDAHLTISDGGGIIAWTEAIKDPRDSLEAVRGVMSADITQRFDSQSDPWGAGWMPRSITTLEIRAEQGKDPTPTRFAFSARIVDGGMGIRIGFNKNPIARYFHLGNPSNRVFGGASGPIPARPILPLTSSGIDLPEELRRDIMRAFREAFIGTIRRRTPRPVG